MARLVALILVRLALCPAALHQNPKDDAPTEKEPWQEEIERKRASIKARNDGEEQRLERHREKLQKTLMEHARTEELLTAKNAREEQAISRALGLKTQREHDEHANKAKREDRMHSMEADAHERAFKYHQRAEQSEMERHKLEAKHLARQEEKAREQVMLQEKEILQDVQERARRQRQTATWEAEQLMNGTALPEVERSGSTGVGASGFLLVALGATLLG